MLTAERQANILKILKENGRIVAREAAQALGVSDDTLRRDLRELAEKGALQRVHGGALPAASAAVDLAGRALIGSAEKARLAARGAALLRPRQVVFVDGGTTALKFAQALPDALAVTVVTHSPSIAAALASHPSVEVELIGGRLFKHSAVAMGTRTVRAIERVRPDVFVMGVTGLHPDAGATTGDAQEADLKALIATQSAETMVLASAEKIGAVSPYLILPLADISTIVASAEAVAEMGDDLLRLGVSLVVD